MPKSLLVFALMITFVSGADMEEESLLWMGHGRILYGILIPVIVSFNLNFVKKTVYGANQQSRLI